MTLPEGIVLSLPDTDGRSPRESGCAPEHIVVEEDVASLQLRDLGHTGAADDRKCCGQDGALDHEGFVAKIR
jgi:hypothetical protein